MFLFGGEINGTAIAARRSLLQAKMRARQAAVERAGEPVRVEGTRQGANQAANRGAR
jgi:hypothetical protein